MQDATVKWLVDTVPICQILFVRSAILVIGCLGAGGRPLVRHAATTPTRALLIRRGAVTLVAWVCYFSAARFLPLGQLVTLYFTAPVIVMLLAAPLLGEQRGVGALDGGRACLYGTVLAANPVGLSLSPATLLVLAGALLWGYGVILTRQIARREPSLVQMFFNNCFSWWSPASAAHLRGVNSVVARCGYLFSWAARWHRPVQLVRICPTCPGFTDRAA